MALLVIGIALWIAAHLFKRVAPGARGDLAARLGAGPARGIFAALIGLSLVLIVIGFRAAPYVAVYTPPGWTVHLNNLLMLIAVFLFGAANAPSRVKTVLRNPMLTGVLLWAIAHILVNGDLAGLILFGAMGLWAIASMALIDTAAPRAPVGPVPPMADLRLALISLVVFAAIAGIHAWLGRWPFPG
ncbi:MAG: hypothetical protein DI556_04975 [Rhodovulum sulfidophilum]|uniref:NnrU domain-containing protein n=1 Tax=Rhodovulum sulfidophilum TaxID=35806 RepID=A0A2W5NDB7_RHOSU|nr:MAG: hypothetical protein DI556_04975 [Rhodovulum sulfidophilum]